MRAGRACSMGGAGVEVQQLPVVLRGVDQQRGPRVGGPAPHPAPPRGVGKRPPRSRPGRCGCFRAQGASSWRTVSSASLSSSAASVASASQGSVLNVHLQHAHSTAGRQAAARPHSACMRA